LWQDGLNRAVATRECALDSNCAAERHNTNARARISRAERDKHVTMAARSVAAIVAAPAEGRDATF
jgi:hypothetical protein